MIRRRLSVLAILGSCAVAIGGCAEESATGPGSPVSMPVKAMAAELGPITPTHTTGFFDTLAEIFDDASETQTKVAGVAAGVAVAAAEVGAPQVAAGAATFAGVKGVAAGIYKGLQGVAEGIDAVFGESSSTIHPLAAQPSQETEPSPPETFEALVRHEIRFNEQVLLMDCEQIVDAVIPIRENGFFLRCERAKRVAEHLITILLRLSEELAALEPPAMAELNAVVDESPDVVQSVAEITVPTRDPDGDGVPNFADPCPGRDQDDIDARDQDGDGIVDPCDVLPDVPS